MANENIKVGVTIAFAGVENITQLKKELESTFKQFGKMFKEGSIEFNLANLKQLQAVIEKFTMSIKELKALKSNDIQVSISDDSIKKLKTAIEGILQEGLSKRAKRIKSDASAGGGTGKGAKAVMREIRAEQDVDQQILEQIGLRQAAQLKSIGDSFERFRRALAQIGRDQGKLRGEIAKRLGKNAVEGFASFNIEASKEFDSLFKGFQRSLVKNFSRAEELIDKAREGLIKFGVSASDIDSDFENLRKAIGKVENTTEEAKNEAFKLASQLQLSKTSISGYKDLIQSIEIYRRTTQETIRTNRQAIKVENRVQERLGQTAGLFREARERQQEFLSGDASAKIKQFTDRFSRLNQQITNDQKLIQRLGDAYQAEFDGARVKVNELNLALDKLKKQKAGAVASGDTEQVKALSAQIDLNNTLKKSYESIKSSRDGQIQALRAESDQLFKTGARVRSYIDSLRSTTRVYDETDRVVERVQRNYSKLRLETEAATRVIKRLEKAQSGTALLDDEQAILAKRSIEGLGAQLKALQKNYSELGVAQDEFIKRLRDQKNATDASGQRVGAGIFEGLEAKEADELFKTIETITKQRFQNMRSSIQIDMAGIRNILLGETGKAVKGSVKNFDKFKKIRGQIDSTGTKVDGLVARLKAFSRVGTVRNIVDTRSLLSAAEGAKVIQKEYKSVSAEVERLRGQAFAFGRAFGEVPKQVAGELAKLERKASKLRSQLGTLKDVGEITFRADTILELERNFKKTSRGSDNLQNRIKFLEKQLRKGGAATIIAADELKQLDSRARSGAKAARKLMLEYEMLEQEGIKLSASQQKLKQAAARVEKQFQTAQATIKRNAKEIEEAGKEAREAGKKFAFFTDEVAKSVKSNLIFFNSMTIITSAIFSVQMAFSQLIEESRVLARTFTVMRSNSMSFAEIQETVAERVREAAIVFGESVETTAEVVKQLGSAGFSAEESLSALNSTMQLIVSTQAEAEASARTIAGLYRIWGDEIRGAGSATQAFTKINDVLISVYRNHQVELDELNQGFKFAAAAANAAGFSFQDTAAFLAVLNDNMIKSGTAGRGLQVIFAQLSNKTQQFSEAFGVALDPGKSLNEQFVTILEEVNGQLSTGALTTSELQKQFKIFGLRGARSFITLAKNFKSVQGTLKELNEDAEGTADALSTIVQDSLAKQFESAKQTLLDLGRLFVEPMKDVIVIFSDVVKVVRDAAKAFDGINFASSFIVVVTVLGGMTVALGAVVRLLFTLGSELVAARTFASQFFKGLLEIQAGSAGASAGLNLLSNSARQASASLGAAAASTTAFGRAAQFMAGPGGWIGILAVTLGTLAFAYNIAENSTRELNREIQRTANIIRETDDNVKKLEEFSEKLQELRQLQGSGIDEELFGQKVKDAYAAAGDNLVNQRAILSMTTAQVAKDFESMQAEAQTLIRLQLQVQKERRRNANIKQFVQYGQRFGENFGVDPGLRADSNLDKFSVYSQGRENILRASELLKSAKAFDQVEGAAKKYDNRVKELTETMTKLVVAKAEVEVGSIEMVKINLALREQQRLLEAAIEKRDEQAKLLAKSKADVKELNRLSKEYIAFALELRTAFGKEQADKIRKQFWDRAIFLADSIGWDKLKARTEEMRDFFEKEWAAEISNKNIKFAVEKQDLTGEMEILQNAFQGMEQIRMVADAPFEPRLFQSIYSELEKIENKNVALRESFVRLNEGIMSGDMGSLVGQIGMFDTDIITKVLQKQFSGMSDDVRDAVKNRLAEVYNVDVEGKNFFKSILNGAGVVNEETGKTVLKFTAMRDLFSEISNTAGGTKEDILNMSKALANEQILRNLEDVNGQLERMIRSMKDAVFSELTFNPIRQMRLDARQLNQEAQLYEKLQGNLNDLMDQYAQQLSIVVEKRMLDKNAQDGISDANKKLAEEADARAEALKKLIDLKASEIRLYKQVRDAIVSGATEIVKQSISLDMVSKNLKSQTAILGEKIKRERQILALEIRQDKELEKLTGSYTESIAVLGGYVEKLSEIVELQQELRQSVIDEAALRFDLLERSAKIVDEENKRAGIQFKILNIATRATEVNERLRKINEDINAEGKVSAQNARRRRKAYDDLLSLFEEITGLRDKEKKKEQELNSIADKRIETLKKLKALFEEDTSEFGKSVSDFLNKEIASDKLATAIKLAKSLGVSTVQVLRNTSGATKEYVERLQEGTLQTNYFGKEISHQFSRMREFREETENISGVIGQIARVKFDAAIKNVTDAISAGDVKAARKYADTVAQLIDDVAGDDRQKKAELLRQLLDIENQLTVLKDKGRQVQVNLVANYDEFIRDIIEQLQGRVRNEIAPVLANEFNASLTANLALSEESRKKLEDEIRAVFADGATRAEVGFVIDIDSQEFADVQLELKKLQDAFNDITTLFRNLSDKVGARAIKNIDALSDSLSVFKQVIDDISRRAGMPVRREMTGGRIPGFGGGDTVPALLEPGEFVIPKESVRKYGTSFFEALRNGSLPAGRFADGGLIGSVKTKLGNALGNQKLVLEITSKELKALLKAQEKATDALEASNKIALSTTKPASLQEREGIQQPVFDPANLTAARDAFKEIGKELRDSSQKTESWKRTLSEVTGLITDNLGKAVSEFSKTWTKFLFDVFVFEFAKANAETYRTFLQTSRQIQNTYVQQTDTAIEQLARNEQSYYSYLNSIRDAEKARIKERIDAERQYRQELVTTEEVFNQTVGKSFETVLGKFSEKAPGVIKQASDTIFGSYTENMDKLFGSADAIFTSFGLDSSSNLKEAGLSLVESLVGASGNVYAQVLGSLIPVIADGIMAIVNLAIADNGKEIALFITRFAQELPKYAQGFIEKMAENVSVVMNAMAQAAPVVIETFAKTIPEAVNVLVNILETSLPQIVTAIADNIPTLIEGMVPAIMRLAVLIFAQLPTILSALVEAIPGTVVAVIETIFTRDFAVSLARAVAQAMTPLWAVRGAARGVGNLFNEGPFHNGGVIPGNYRDVLIMAQSGEGVLSRQGLKALGGKSVLDKLNSGVNPFLSAEYNGRMDTFHNGGIVGRNIAPSSSVSGGSTNNTYTNNITVNASPGSSDAETRRRAKLLADEIDKALAKKVRDRSSKLGSQMKKR